MPLMPLHKGQQVTLQSFSFEAINSYFGGSATGVEIQSAAVRTSPNIDRTGALPMLRPKIDASTFGDFGIHQILKSFLGSVA